MPHMRHMSREIGTALAVLAIYLLTLLAPMHHARASQLGFAELGYATIEASWVLCTPAGVDAPDSDVTIAKCPATGVGKTDLTPPASSVLPVHDRVALAAPLLAPAQSFIPAILTAPGGPRAPPVPV